MNFTEKYRLKAVEWAKLDGTASQLEEMKKIVLAEIKQQQLNIKSEAGKETAAYASPEYRRHIEAMVAARTKANICRGELKAMELGADLWRSKESTRRAEMTLR